MPRPPPPPGPTTGATKSPSTGKPRVASPSSSADVDHRVGSTSVAAVIENGKGCLNASEWSQAVDHFTQALELTPVSGGGSEDRETRIKLYLWRGGANIKDERYTSALADANACLDLLPGPTHPQWVKAKVLLGCAQQGTGRTLDAEQARQTFGEVLAADPGNVIAHGKLRALDSSSQDTCSSGDSGACDAAECTSHPGGPPDPSTAELELGGDSVPLELDVEELSRMSSPPNLVDTIAVAAAASAMASAREAAVDSSVSRDPVSRPVGGEQSTASPVATRATVSPTRDISTTLYRPDDDGVVGAGVGATRPRLVSITTPDEWIHAVLWAASPCPLMDASTQRFWQEIGRQCSTLELHGFLIGLHDTLKWSPVALARLVSLQES